MILWFHTMQTWHRSTGMLKIFLFRHQVIEYFNEIYIKNILETKSLPFMEKFSLQDQRKKRERERERQRETERQREAPEIIIYLYRKIYFLTPKYLTVKPPNSGHPKWQAYHEYRTKHLVPNVTIFLKLPHNSGHLSITDKFFKTRSVR